MMSQAYHLYLFGTFRLEQDAQRLQLPRRKVESLLAYLALYPHKHTREKLAALLWGDYSDEQARASLRNTLSILRKELGEELLLADRESIQLNPNFPLWVDVVEFSRVANSISPEPSQTSINDFQSALSHYHGDLLADFYDDWILLEREHLLGRFEHMMARWLEHLVETENWAEVQAQSERWISLGRTPEPAYCALMLAYSNQGDSAKVTATFQRCAQALRDDLGVEPSAQTRALYEQLARGEKPSAIARALARIITPTTPFIDANDPPAPGEPPYKGLHYFDEDDADLFFGRELLIARLVGHLRASRFLAVIVGASGSGKSSLVRAGLVPALKRGLVLADGTMPPTDSPAWITRILTPTAAPLDALEETLTRETPTAHGLLTSEMRGDAQALTRFVNQNPPFHDAPLLLILDQFEELFALCRDEFARRAFIDNLLNAVTPAVVAPGARGVRAVVITLRADFYAHCAQYANLRDAVAEHQVYIGPMNVEELRRAIEAPAQQRRAADGGAWTFEPGLVDVMLRDVGKEPGALPLLSHALLETWARRSGHVMTLQGYAQAGGVRGAIARTAESIFNQRLTSAQQELARRIFLRLTEFGQDSSNGELPTDTRRRATLSELHWHADDKDAVQAVLKILVDARLITVEEHTIQIAHEALIHEWGRLREWLSQDRAGLQIHRHLTQAAQEWQALGSESDALYRGARLAQARDWAQTHREELNEPERAFLELSEENAQRAERERKEQQQRELAAAQQLAETRLRAAQQLRRRAFFLAGAFVLAIVLAVLALLFGAQARDNALAAEKEQRIAFARELAAASEGNLQDDPERSILLALQAVTATNTINQNAPKEAVEALHRAVQASRVDLTLSGHKAEVWGVAYSPDGTRIATASQDRTAKIWDALTGKELVTLIGHSDSVNGIAFSPDGKQIATTSDDRTAKLWDAATGKELITLSGHADVVQRVAFRPDGKQLATASLDHTARVWDASSGKLLRTLPGKNLVVEVAYSLDGKTLATGAAGDGWQGIQLWETESGKPLRELPTRGDVRGIAFSPDGAQLAATTNTGAQLWELPGGKELQTLGGHTDKLTDLAFSPDGALLATSSSDSTVKLWDLASSRELFTLHGHTRGVNGIAFNPSASQLVTAGLDGLVKVWDLSERGESLVASAPGFGYVAYSPDGTQVAVGTGNVAKIWDVKTGRLLTTLEGHTDKVTRVAYSPDGKRLATASFDKTARVWDVATGKLLQVFNGTHDWVVGLAFSPDGTRVASAGLYDDNKIRIWDSTSGQELLALSGHTDNLNQVVYSPDGTRLASASRDQTARIWDAQTGKPLQILRGHTNEIWSVAFSPDGKQLASASQDGTVKIWDLETGKELASWTAHSGLVFTIVFSPDGTQLATASGDGTVKLWDVKTKQELLRLDTDGEADGVAFRLDGKQLAVGSDKTVRVFLLDLDDLKELAHERVTRALTTEECIKYLHVAQCPP